MRNIKNLTIDRRYWLRGEGAMDSKLLRKEDGKQCCLGFYLRACGFKKSQILDKPTPARTKLPLPVWLISSKDDKYNEHSKIANDLILVNDSQVITPDVREQIIIKDFASIGVKVTFKN